MLLEPVPMSVLELGPHLPSKQEAFPLEIRSEVADAM